MFFQVSRLASGVPFRFLLVLVLLNPVAVFAQAPAPPQPILLPVTTGAGCIIQSNFGGGGHKNFETVVLQGKDLVHYWHDNQSVDYTWHRGQIITHQATGY